MDYEALVRDLAPPEASTLDEIEQLLDASTDQLRPAGRE